MQSLRRLLKVFARLVLRWSGPLAILGTLLAFVGAHYSIQLFKNLRTNFEELLPTDARSVKDLSEVTRRLQSIDNLGILVFSQNPEAGKRFVADLAQRLKLLPKDIASSVEYQISNELHFFKEREALYLDVGDLRRIESYVHDKIEYEKSLYNPLNLLSSDAPTEPKLDFGALRKKYETGLSAYDHFPGGYYATPDGTKRVILVYSGQASSLDKTVVLKQSVEKLVAELNPKSYAPDLQVKYTGGVEDTIEEHDALIADLELSTLIVIGLVAVAMLAFYRNIRATFALVFSLFMGTFWTFGISYFVVGYLNANSAFLGSIVIGNGINFGIIFLARYLEERRNNHGNTRAAWTAMTRTATSTWTAALGAGLSYGSLILTGFRGFRQFGIIGLFGMVLCWISAYTLLPAYLTLLDKIYPIVKKGARQPKAYLANAVANFIGRFPRLVWGAAVVASVLSLALLTRYNSGILETDLSQLRNKDSLEHGSAYLSRYLDEIFQRYLSPMVILPHNREDARKIASLLKEKKAREGDSSLIASVQTLDDFMPAEQAEKVQVLHRIKSLLPPKIYYRMPRKEQQDTKDFLTPEVFRPVRSDELPSLLLSKFTEKDGTIGNLVLVEPPLGDALREGDHLVSFVQDLRNTADSVAKDIPVAGSITITADMLQAISHDGPKATFFAFLAVMLLVVILFRNPGTIAMILFSLILGVLWLAGLILGFWFKINFLNFIALPITFGIGVDYGVNMFHRYREEGGGNILDVIRHTGGAVALCSFTTVVGYCSLLIAGNRAFVSFGRLAVLGEITCVLAAVVAMPAYLLLRYQKQKALSANPPAAQAKSQPAPLEL